MLSHLPIEIFGKRQKRGIQEGEVNCIKYDLLYRFQYTDIEGISYKIFFFLFNLHFKNLSSWTFGKFYPLRMTSIFQAFPIILQRSVLNKS